jgi:hypothetical protein
MQVRPVSTRVTIKILGFELSKALAEYDDGR